MIVLIQVFKDNHVMESRDKTQAAVNKLGAKPSFLLRAEFVWN